jgi:hypothetical protein
MQCEYEKWVYVEAHDPARARELMGFMPDWPCETAGFSTNDSNCRVYRLLSPAYIAQENAKRANPSPRGNHVP